MKCMSKHKDFDIFVLKLSEFDYFQPLKVVDRDSEIQRKWLKM